MIVELPSLEQLANVLASQSVNCVDSDSVYNVKIMASQLLTEGSNVHEAVSGTVNVIINTPSCSELTFKENSEVYKVVLPAPYNDLSTLSTEFPLEIHEVVCVEDSHETIMVSCSGEVGDRNDVLKPTEIPVICTGAPTSVTVTCPRIEPARRCEIIPNGKSSWDTSLCSAEIILPDSTTCTCSGIGKLGVFLETLEFQEEQRVDPLHESYVMLVAGVGMAVIMLLGASFAHRFDLLKRVRGGTRNKIKRVSPDIAFDTKVFDLSLPETIKSASASSPAQRNRKTSIFRSPRLSVSSVIGNLPFVGHRRKVLFAQNTVQTEMGPVSRPDYLSLESHWDILNKIGRWVMFWRTDRFVGHLDRFIWFCGWISFCVFLPVAILDWIPDTFDEDKASHIVLVSLVCLAVDVVVFSISLFLFAQLQRMINGSSLTTDREGEPLKRDPYKELSLLQKIGRIFGGIRMIVIVAVAFFCGYTVFMTVNFGLDNYSAVNRAWMWICMLDITSMLVFLFFTISPAIVLQKRADNKFADFVEEEVKSREEAIEEERIATEKKMLEHYSAARAIACSEVNNEMKKRQVLVSKEQTLRTQLRELGLKQKANVASPEEVFEIQKKARMQDDLARELTITHQRLDAKVDDLRSQLDIENQRSQECAAMALEDKIGLGMKADEILEAKKIESEKTMKESENCLKEQMEMMKQEYEKMVEALQSSLNDRDSELSRATSEINSLKSNKVLQEEKIAVADEELHILRERNDASISNTIMGVKGIQRAQAWFKGYADRQMVKSLQHKRDRDRLAMATVIQQVEIDPKAVTSKMICTYAFALHYREHDYAKAGEMYFKALTTEQVSENAALLYCYSLFLRSVCARGAEADEAENYLKVARAMDPVCSTLSSIYQTCLLDSIHDDPTDGQALLNMALYFEIIKEDYSKAELFYKLALRADSSDSVGNIRENWNLFQSSTQQGEEYRSFIPQHVVVRHESALFALYGPSASDVITRFVSPVVALSSSSSSGSGSGNLIRPVPVNTGANKGTWAQLHMRPKRDSTVSVQSTVDIQSIRLSDIDSPFIRRDKSLSSSANHSNQSSDVETPSDVLSSELWNGI
eukprot:TRINITY_DN2957_c2_g1_i1.p1 TRINITY_DN2957_c2_g1~~TRINITY_DN2957_c2_g1_i1.p1  ORF type:complete len:1180 (-),score=411.70 TRINITY_DN2957_c2_g1_i1:793-4083(-)